MSGAEAGGALFHHDPNPGEVLDPSKGRVHIVLRVLDRRGQSAPHFLKLGDLLMRFASEAQAGDPVAKEAFDFAGRLLGIAVANHINMTDPARLLVYVLYPEMAELITAPFYAALHENTLPVLRGRTPLQLKVGPEARHTHGAAAIVLEQLYGKGGPRTTPHAVAADPGGLDG